MKYTIGLEGITVHDTQNKLDIVNGTVSWRVH